jgi:hypothetical protein
VLDDAVVIRDGIPVPVQVALDLAQELVQRDVDIPGVQVAGPEPEMGADGRTRPVVVGEGCRVVAGFPRHVPQHTANLGLGSTG